MSDLIKDSPGWSYSLRIFWRNRVRGWWIDHRWQIIGILGIFALVLATIGFRIQSSASGDKFPLSHAIYCSLQLFMLDGSNITLPVVWQLNVARYLAGFVGFFTVLQALAVIFREQIQILIAKTFKNHIIICGLGEKGMMIAERFIDQGYRVLVIEEDTENDNIAQCRENGAVVLIGDATDPAMLSKARAKYAQYLILVCDNDGTNAEIAVQVKEQMQGRSGKPLVCIIHLILPQMCHLLRKLEIRSAESDSMRIEFFNIFDSGARALLDECLIFNDQVDESIETDPDEYKGPHIVVIGVGRMGESIILHAVRKWCAIYAIKKKRLRISMVDKDAEMKHKLITKQYPFLEKVCDLIPVTMDVRSAEFLQEAETVMQDANIHTKCIVYVCFDNESFSLLTALSLLQRTKENSVPIVVRMIRDTWSNFLTEEDSCDFGCLRIFGLLDRTLQPELILGGMHESLARSIHNDYIRRQINMGYTIETNPSMVSWDMLSSEFKELNRNRADRIITQLKAIGCYIGPLSDWDIESFKFSDDEIETIAKMEHKQYVEERTNKGFRYGIDKDNDKRTNPNLVPWAKLDDKVKDQNREEIRRFPLLLAQVDLQIYRMTNTSFS